MLASPLFAHSKALRNKRACKGDAMTEAEWLASTDPDAMLDFVRPNATDRKLRLFACACCRRHWNWLRCIASKRAVEQAERFADGLIARGELAGARNEATRALGRVPDSHLYAAEAAASLVRVRMAPACRQTAALMRKQRACWTPVPRAYRGRILDFSEHAAAKAAWDQAGAATERREGAQQALLLRDIFGNPFRSHSHDTFWLTHAVTGLASAIYRERCFEQLPELATLLHQAGCPDADLLAHCRVPGSHARGCWCLDLLLRMK
jgi:hypothetical protein